MSGWFGSASFVVFSALFGCVFGFGLAATARAFKDRKSEKQEKSERGGKKGE